jgi:hypothetical protein
MWPSGSCRISRQKLLRWPLAAEPVTSVDVTAVDALRELDETLHAAGIELCFAEMNDSVKDKMKRFGLFTRFGEQNLLRNPRRSSERLPC